MSEIQEKKAKILALLESSEAAVCKALVVIYEHQTASEQAAGVTVSLNGVGFSAHDAEFGSSLAQKIKKGWKMSPKQIAAGRKLVKHYWKQLVAAADAKSPGWHKAAPAPVPVPPEVVEFHKEPALYV
jgi:hypothetical protein